MAAGRKGPGFRFLQDPPRSVLFGLRVLLQGNRGLPEALHSTRKEVRALGCKGEEHRQDRPQALCLRLCGVQLQHHRDRQPELPDEHVLQRFALCRRGHRVRQLLQPHHVPLLYIGLRAFRLRLRARFVHRRVPHREQSGRRGEGCSVFKHRARKQPVRRSFEGFRNRSGRGKEIHLHPGCG